MRNLTIAINAVALKGALTQAAMAAMPVLVPILVDILVEKAWEVRLERMEKSNRIQDQVLKYNQLVNAAEQRNDSHERTRNH